MDRTQGDPRTVRYERRLELYQRAMPVFARLGYRDTTLKALANACGLSIPALYRYFPSKKAFALFPLVALLPELHAPPPDVSGDPRTFLSDWIDAAARWFPYYTLALRLSREAGLTAQQQATMSANLAEHAALLAGVARRAAPQLTDRRAGELATAMLSAVAGPAGTGLPSEKGALRHQLIALLNGYGITLRPRAR